MNKKNSRKVIYILLIVLLVGLLIFFINKFIIKSKVVKCELNNDSSVNKYEQKTDYIIYSKMDNVLKVEINETISSKNTTIVKYFTNQIKNNYEQEKKKYKGYILETKEGRNKSIFNVNIDYSKLNVKDYAKDKKIKEKNNKISLKDMQDYYEMLGAKCK